MSQRAPLWKRLKYHGLFIAKNVRRKIKHWLVSPSPHKAPPPENQSTEDFDPYPTRSNFREIYGPRPPHEHLLSIDSDTSHPIMWNNEQEFFERQSRTMQQQHQIMHNVRPLQTFGDLAIEHCIAEQLGLPQPRPRRPSDIRFQIERNKYKSNNAFGI